MARAIEHARLFTAAIPRTARFSTLFRALPSASGSTFTNIILSTLSVTAAYR